MTHPTPSIPRSGAGLSPAAASSLGQLLGRPIRVESPVSTADALPRQRPLPPRPPRILGQPQILDATLACLLEEGYDGTTIRTIARRLDCAVGSIYRYFRDKRDLLEQVTYQHFRPALDAFEASPNADGLAASVTTYAQIATGHAQLYRLMFWLASVGDADTPARQPVVVTELITAWSGVLGSPQAAEARWIQLHGQLMLGRGENAAIEAAAQASQIDEPQVTTLQAVAQESPSFEEDVTDEPDDDLTLL